MPPPLSYSYPSYKSTDYDNYRDVITNIVNQGFNWITFTPSYRVTVPWYSNTLNITTNSTPVGKIQEAVNFAAEKGLNVKLEPHLDWSATLDGGEEDWRRRMFFMPNPLNIQPLYDQIVIEPLMDIIDNAANTFTDTCFALTLGSELDVSLVQYPIGPMSWLSLLERMKARRTISGLDSPLRLFFGHKLNHDTLTFNRDLRTSLNKEREKRNIPELTIDQFAQRASLVYEYLKELDYVSFSFYPLVQFRKPDDTIATDDWWKGTTTEADINSIAETFENSAKELKETLEQNGAGAPLFDIGEFGLGGADPSRSYRSKHNEFINEDGSMKDGIKEMRRKFYKGFLRFVEQDNSVFTDNLDGTNCKLPITFWTTGHFDFMDLLAQEYTLGEQEDGSLVFKDDELIEVIRTMNGVENQPPENNPSSSGVPFSESLFGRLISWLYERIRELLGF